MVPGDFAPAPAILVCIFIYSYSCLIAHNSGVIARNSGVIVSGHKLLQSIMGQLTLMWGHHC